MRRLFPSPPLPPMHMRDWRGAWGEHLSDWSGLVLLHLFADCRAVVRAVLPASHVISRAP